MPPGHRSRGRFGAVVFAVAVLPHAMTLRLAFQLDDYNILSLLYRFVETGTKPAIQWYFFRPTCWVLWALLMKLGGGIAHAPVFHAVLLLSHGLTAWLLYRVLRSAIDVRSAAIGAALFGLAPGGLQAVTWIAAAGDQFALLLLLVAVVACQRFARSGRIWLLPVVAVATGASFLAKETAVILLPAAVLGLWSVPRGERRHGRWWLPAAAACVGLMAGVLARWAHLGILGPAYPYDVSLTRDELAAWHRPFLQMLAPWTRAPEFAEMPPVLPSWLARLGAAAPGKAGEILGDPAHVLWIAVIGALGIPIGLGLHRNPHRIPRAVLLLGALALAFLPCVAAWHFGTVATNALSRTFYAPLAIFFAFLAVSIDPLFIQAGAFTRMLRRLALVALAVFTALEIDLAVHVWRTELLVTRRIESRLESLAAIARSESPDTHLIAIDTESGLGGAPLVGVGITHALGRPFSDLDRSVSWWNDLATLDRCPALRDVPAPIRIAAVANHRFVPVGELIPAIPATMPSIAKTATTPYRFEFSEAVATRAFAAVRLQVRRVAGVDPGCVWEGESGAGDKVTMPGSMTLPPSGDVVTVLLLPPGGDERPWRALSMVRAIELRGLEAAGPPTIVAKLPDIELGLAIADHIVALGALPRISFRVPFDSHEYRITFDFMVGVARFPMIYTVARDRLQRAADRAYVFIPAKGDVVEWLDHSYQVTWFELPDAFRREVSAYGLHQIAVQFRVQGIASDGVTPEAESQWDTLTILDETIR